MKTLLLILIATVTLILTACGEKNTPIPYTKKVEGYTIKGQYSPHDIVTDTITQINALTLNETTIVRITRARVGRWTLYHHDSLIGYAVYKDGRTQDWRLPDDVPEELFLYGDEDSTGVQ